MSTLQLKPLSDQPNPFVAGVAALEQRRRKRAAEKGERVQPFVTISRQAGAGGRSLAQRLVEHLNRIDPGPAPWRGFDHELVEKVATDNKLAAELIDGIEDRRPSLLQDFLANLSFRDVPSEERIYHRVIATVRALAERGRAVIVGQGGVYITRNMPGGVHLRLVAPQTYRVGYMARKLGVGREQAEQEVRRLDTHREQFYGRYWHGEIFAPEIFTVTFNTALLEDQKMVESIVPLLAREEEEDD